MVARFIYMLVCIDLFSYFNTLKREKFHSPPVGERSPSVGKFLAPPLRYYKNIFHFGENLGHKIDIFIASIIWYL